MLTKKFRQIGIPDSTPVGSKNAGESNRTIANEKETSN